MLRLNSTAESIRKNTLSLSPLFLLLTVIFCVCLIVSNIMEIKTVALGPLTITAGMIVFPVSYIINDCLVEVYGFGKARLVIWLGFMSNLLVSLLLQIGLWLPGAETWTGQDAMVTIFSPVPRILAASFAAFLCGSLANAYVMHRMRLTADTGGNSGFRHSFSARAIISTLWGESIDSAIFFPLAFAGNLPWSVILTLMVTQALLKTIYELLVLPVTVKIVKLIRRAETLTPSI